MLLFFFWFLDNPELKCHTKERAEQVVVRCMRRQRIKLFFFGGGGGKNGEVVVAVGGEARSGSIDTTET